MRRHQRLPQRLLAMALGTGLTLISPGVRAAENVVIVTGAFERSIPVADLDHLARTGEARGLLATALQLGKQDPKEVVKVLNQSLSLPIALVSRLMNTRIGEAVLSRISAIIYPLKAGDVGISALRSAVIEGLAKGNGSITAVSFLQAYPTAEMEVNLPALMTVMSKTRSIADLVRFFSESPLDGLRPPSASAKGPS
ncbi:MAG: alpha/beta hydrolase [Cyanobacteriota bacterium]